MVESRFLKALKHAGFTEVKPSYDRYNKFYTVIKLSNEEQAEEFRKHAKRLGLKKFNAKLFKGSSEIWVFHAYN